MRNLRRILLSADLVFQALDDRLQLLKPRLLIAESSYSYNGRKHDILRKIDATVSRLQQSENIEVIIVGPMQKLRSMASVSNGKRILGLCNL